MTMISVIVVSVIGSPYLEECLDALHEQEGEFDIEIIVVTPLQGDAVDRIKKKFPQVKLLTTSSRIGIPQLRALGLSHAAGETVAITEDCCIPAKNWCAEIVRAHRSGYDVVGGAIENGSSNTSVNWAAYFCEYSERMMPIPDGDVDGLAGNNSSYRKSVFEKVDESFIRDYWEYFLYRELKRLDVKMRSVPTIVVNKRKEHRFVPFLRQRFHFSRSFAGMRSTHMPTHRRLFYAVSSPLLPFLMTWRIARQVIRKKRFRFQFLRALPLLSLFLISYAGGEASGYLFGAGNSLEKVE